MTKEALNRLNGWNGIVAGVVLILSAVASISAGFFAAHLMLVFLFIGVYLNQRKASGILGIWAFVIITAANVVFVGLQGLDAFLIPGLMGTWLLGAFDAASPLLPGAIPFVVGTFAFGLLLQAFSFQRSGAFPIWLGWSAFGAIFLNLLNGWLTLPAPAALLAPLLMGAASIGLGMDMRKG
ncbi:MAG: hypothetical protein DWG76_04605 [Chloroflexi bacterium]|nr:hypothetical protein [Chloroflexota bacterium]MQC26717.1 hypothetical protein [Chloroflexota bacterium]